MERKKSERYQQPLTCLLIDIDHFKSVNDAYGHKAGDSVLLEIAQILKKSLREVDTPARWGGEEFTAILPETDSEQGTLAATRILERISNHTFEQLPDKRITVSIGLASRGDFVNTTEALIVAADGALYEAKRKGRNRIEIAPG